MGVSIYCVCKVLVRSKVRHGLGVATPNSKMTEFASGMNAIQVQKRQEKSHQLSMQNMPPNGPSVQEAEQGSNTLTLLALGNPIE